MCFATKSAYTEQLLNAPIGPFSQVLSHMALRGEYGDIFRCSCCWSGPPHLDLPMLLMKTKLETRIITRNYVDY